MRLRGPAVSAAVWLGRGHALAGVAGQRCRAVHPDLTARQRLGRVACGQCWEAAVRADERVAAEFELPAESPAPDLSYVDPVAVERAAAGERVRLTRAERAELTRAAYAGTVSWRAVERQGIGGSTARQLAAAAQPAPAVEPDSAELAVAS